MRKKILDIKKSRMLRMLLARKSVVVCIVILLIMIIAAIFAPLVAPYDPNEQNLTQILKGMSWQHIFGTDGLGRDVLSRLIYGARVSFTVGFISVIISGLLGMIIGLIAGMSGNIIDAFIMRIMDAMMSIPVIILALFLGSIIGKGLFNICLAIGICMIPGYARVTRGQVLMVKGSDYVTAGTLSGASKFTNAVKHVLPNCVSINIIMMTMSLGAAILVEAALSFLGMGINPPTASWGSMVNDGYSKLSTNPVIAIVPGICIMMVVLSFSIVGDAMRDAMDPKLKGTIGGMGKKRAKLLIKKQK